MNLGQARDIFQRVLAPLSVDVFLDEKFGKQSFKLERALNDSARGNILGADPVGSILGDFGRSAHRIISHAKAPLGPPPPLERVSGAAAFKNKVDAFHAQGYTVRLSEMRGLTPALEQLVRALEFIFKKPMQPDIYWSRGDARAPVHHDDYDLFVIQLKGRKRWYLSTDPLTLPNEWRPIPTAPETLGADPATIDVEPGDFMYIPRGVVHAVDALSESIHVSIGFAPITLREAMIACIDQLSEDDVAFRETVSPRIAEQIALGNLADLPQRVRAGLERAAHYLRSDPYIGHAMERHVSRIIGGFGALPQATTTDALSGASRLRHTPLAVAEVSGNATHLDFAYPGGHLYIMRGAEEAVRFIADTPEFCVADIPGDFNDEVRIALVQRMLAANFLELA